MCKRKTKETCRNTMPGPIQDLEATIYKNICTVELVLKLTTRYLCT